MTPAEQIAPGPADGGTSALAREAAQSRTSRRHMIRRAGVVAAATVGGLTLLDQRRAEAATGGNFILGQSNDAGATTELHPTTAGATLNPLFRVNGSALSSTSTTVIIDGPPGPQGVGLQVNGATGALGVGVSASSTPTTVGLALSAGGSGTAGGVRGSSGSGAGVTGVSTSGPGVTGSSTSGAGAVGTSSTGTGVKGSGNLGGDFSGKAAAIRLRPAKATTHPTSGSVGDLFVDSGGRLWYCSKGGALATWVKLA